MYEQLCQYLGSTFRDLTTQRKSKALEGYLRSNHAHMLISMPAEYAVEQVICFIKGKSAIHIARNFMGHCRNFTGQYFWANGYYVSIVGRDEVTIRRYIKQQEQKDSHFDQLSMFEA